MTVLFTEAESCGRTIYFHNIVIIEMILTYYADVEFNFWDFQLWDLYPLWGLIGKSSGKWSVPRENSAHCPPLCQLRPLTSSPMLDVAGSKTWSSLRKPQPEKSLRGHGLHLNSIWFLSVLTSEKYRDEQEKIISYGHLHSDKGPCLPPGTITSVHLLLMDSNINSQEIQITIWFFFLKFVTGKLKFLYIFLFL